MIETTAVTDNVIGLHPREAVSPRDKWKLIYLLHVSKWWSMAFGQWTDAEGTRYVLAQRWNGEGGEKGNPISRGYATWFVLPDETYPLYIESRFIPDDKREKIRTLLLLTGQKK